MPVAASALAKEVRPLDLLDHRVEPDLRIADPEARRRPDADRVHAAEAQVGEEMAGECRATAEVAEQIEDALAGRVDRGACRYGPHGRRRFYCGVPPTEFAISV